MNDSTMKYKWRKWKRKSKGYRFLNKHDQAEVRKFVKFLLNKEENKLERYKKIYE